VSIRNYYEDVRKAFALGSAALAVMAAGCGSSGNSGTTVARSSADDKAAAQAVVRVQAELRRGNFANAWRSLHPAEKRVISVQRLASCYPRNAFPRPVTFRASEVRDVVWQVPGSTTISEAKEVTVTATSAGKTLETFKQHSVRVGGTWTWMLSRAYFAKAKRGAC
jgi:hypothetical protein